MQIRIGTSGYAYKEWKGRFYPEKISPKEMLRFYSERFRTVEINNTFHHMPTDNVLASWAQQVPEGFIFAAKAPQRITHFSRLKHVESETEYLFTTLSTLGDKLGPVLFQLPKSFRVDLPTLQDFLRLIPSYISCAFEFRSPTWMTEEVFELLRSRNCSLCILDREEDPATEITATANWGYLRLRRGDYTEADLRVWAERVLAQKWERAFVFFKHEEEGLGPEFAMRFRDMAGEV